MDNHFKQCPECGHRWPSREALLRDPQVSLCAYQANFTLLDAGQFLFNHTCGTTFSIPAGEFRDLYAGPVFSRSLMGSHDCPGHCQHADDLRPCPARCECAYVREILQIVRQWPKGLGDSPKAE